MKRIVGLFLVALPLLFTGCASVAPVAISAQDAKAKEFAADPSNASLYIYRAESIGAPVAIDLDLNGKSIAKTNNKSYVQLSLAPGNYVIGSHAKNADGLSLTNDSSLPVTLEAGKIYYVKQGVGYGIFYASSDLQTVDEVTGRAGVNASTLISVTNTNFVASLSGQQSGANQSAAKGAIVFGSSGVIVEKLAMKRNCQPVSGASLIVSNGPVEDYVVKCSDGSELGAHCEYHQCVLK